MENYIDIMGLKIHYLDNKKDLPVILFLQGNSQSSSIFKNQFQDKLLNENFRLIAIDLPGHGKSEKARDPEDTYSIPGYGEILKDFCNNLKLKDIIIVGFSLGGHIAIEAVGDLNAKGIVTFGTPFFSNIAELGDALLVKAEDLSYAFNENCNEEDIEFSTRAQFSPDYDKNKIPDFIKDDFRNTDGKARSSFGASLANGTYLDEKKIVEDLKIPLAIIHGRNEKLIKLSYLQSIEAPTLWRGEICIIENAGHGAHLENPGDFNKALFDFAKD